MIRVQLYMNSEKKLMNTSPLFSSHMISNDANAIGSIALRVIFRLSIWNLHDYTLGISIDKTCTHPFEILVSDTVSVLFLV